MADLKFEWDPRKDSANERKHGVTFSEAETAFRDDRAIFIPDPAHSDDEDRFILLGLSSAMRTLVVCHCLRDRGDTTESSRHAKRTS